MFICRSEAAWLTPSFFASLRPISVLTFFAQGEPANHAMEQNDLGFKPGVGGSARALAALLMLAAMAAPGWAQVGTIRVMTHYRIKADKVGDWLAAQREFAALRRKAESERNYTVWQALTGPREYLLVSYYSKWSEMDVVRDPKMTEHAGDGVGIVARLNAATESSTREIHWMQPDLMLPRAAEMPKMVRTARITVASGNVDEVLDALRTMTLPAMKKSGITTYGVGRVRYGSGTNQLMAHPGFNSWVRTDIRSTLPRWPC